MHIDIYIKMTQLFFQKYPNNSIPLKTYKK